MMNRKNSASEVTGFGLHDWSSVPDGSRDMSFLRRIQTDFGASQPSIYHVTCTADPFARDKEDEA
jgi:hypothetical protein